MTTDNRDINLELSRRKLLAAAGIAGGAAIASSLLGATAAHAAPEPNPIPTAPPVAGLHLQFGQDAGSEMVVSWHTLQSAQNPRVMLGTLDGKLDHIVAAQQASYTDAKIRPGRFRLSRETRTPAP